MSDIKMPQRWFRVYDTGWVKDCAGEWVKSEDVEPLVAEITRLRARVEVLERVRIAAQAFINFDALAAALEEAEL